MKNLSLFLLFTINLIFTQTTQATTIVPHTNMGEMALHAEEVVLVTAQRNYEYPMDGMIRFRTNLRVRSSIKGLLQTGDEIFIQDNHIKTDHYETLAYGDLEMEEGQDYLIFLSRDDAGNWTPLMMSFGVFQEKTRDGVSFLVPVQMSNEIHLHERADGQSVEPMAVYRAKPFMQMLREVVQQNKQWDRRGIATNYAPASFFDDGRGTPPAHCVYLFSSQPYARWNDFPTVLPIWYGSTGDPSCSNAVSFVQNAVTEMNTNYAGINLGTPAGHSFVPNCSTGTVGSEFTSWVSNTLGGTRHLVIQFDDPCGEIPNLSANGSGVLARGGTYAFSSTHTWDDMAWRNAAWGYVYTNNGLNNLCNGGYTEMLIHEMTHSLGFGHTSTANGVANMNPSCCNDIQTLDIECLDYTYLLAPLPVDLVRFDGKQKEAMIRLEWETKSEVDNDYFIVEKRNEKGVFEALATVQGSGHSTFNQYYSLLDDDPNFGTNYYRLSQVDFDGVREQFEVLVVEYFNGMNVTIAPNPVSGNDMNLWIESESSDDLYATIVNAMGQEFGRQKWPIEKGVNQFNMPVGDLPQGIYLLVIKDKNGLKKIDRFVKNAPQ